MVSHNNVRSGVVACICNANWTLGSVAHQLHQYLFYRNKGMYAMATEDQVRQIWRSADAVSLDVDSTVLTEEAIDELAAYLGVGQQVQSITNNAMGGAMTYKESLRQRLDIMRPGRQQITRFITDHPPQLTEGVRELVERLHERRVPVYLVSGGFTSIIEPIAEELHIPKENIYANKLLFYYNGEYAGFDERQPTCETGGKSKVMELLKHRFGYQRLVHIGDGVTDMEAYPPADAFIGFGGNQVRDKVRLGAKWFTTSFHELLDELHRKMVRMS